MWWLLAPVVVYVGKKIIDVVTEDDSPSYSSSTYSKLPDQKSKRTIVRKQAVQQVISEHTDRINRQLSEFIEHESDILGEISIDLISYKVKFTSLDKTISELNTANNIVCGNNDVNNKYINSYQLNILSQDSSIVEKVIEKADAEYGSLAGIDSYDDYIENQDNFLTALNKKNNVWKNC
jgi:hypothetical protein